MLWAMDKTFWSLSKNDLRTYYSIRKSGQEYDYTTGSLLDYP